MRRVRSFCAWRRSVAPVRAPTVRRILFGGVRGATEGMPEATGLGC